MSKRRGGDRFVDADGGGEGNTGGTSSTLVGIYSKRQRRISELRLSPALAFGTRATEYRICRKLATSYPSSDPASRPTAPSSSSAPSNSPATSHGSVSKFQFSAESKTFRLATRNFTRSGYFILFSHIPHPFLFLYINSKLSRSFLKIRFS